MIVENNHDLRQTLLHAFECRGYITWTSPTLEMALTVFESVRPEIVILDLDFEAVDLILLLDTWREIAPHTRVVVESTGNDQQLLKRAMDHGAYAFLEKPYTLAPLFHLLENDIPPSPHHRKAA